MNIEEVIAQLCAERDRVNAAIEALERLKCPAPKQPAQPAQPKRRGRKNMDTKARQEVSQRMKRYWTNRRKATEIHPERMLSAMAS